MKLQTVQIKELGNVVTGSTPPTANLKFYGDEYLFIKPSDIEHSNRRVTSTETMLSSAGKGYLKSRLLPKDTTCVVCIGTIGKTCLTSAPCFTNQQINSIVVDKTKHNPIYIYYLIKTAIPKVQKFEGGSASGRELVKKSLFEQIEVDVHPLHVQNKIAAILSSYDDLIENNAQRIRALERMIQAIYHEYIGKTNAKESTSKKTLGDIANKFTDKYGEQLHGELPLLDLSRIPRKTCNISEFGKSSELSTSRIVFQKFDILFGAIRPYFHKVVFAPFNGVTNTSVFVIRPIESIPISYMFSLLFSDETIAWANQHSGGTKMPVINWGVFATMPVVVPSKTILEKFNQLAKPNMEAITNMLLRNANLRTTRDLLLPRLISGEIDVSSLS